MDVRVGTIKKAECWRINAFELWCWRRLLRVPWTVRRSNLSILKEINHEYSLERLKLKLKLHYFGHLPHGKRPWCWEKLRARGEGGSRGWDIWMASPTQWTWVWASSKRLWRTGKPGMLQPMGSQRVKNDLVTEQSWIFIGRTDAEAETPILWPPDVKNWLIWKDPDAGKDWRWEEKGTTEDKTVGWYHTTDMSGSKLRELVIDREAWGAAVHGVSKRVWHDWATELHWLSDWTTKAPGMIMSEGKISKQITEYRLSPRSEIKVLSRRQHLWCLGPAVENFPLERTTV